MIAPDEELWRRRGFDRGVNTRECEERRERERGGARFFFLGAVSKKRKEIKSLTCAGDVLFTGMGAGLVAMKALNEESR